MGYQSEAELEERLMQKLESQGYERIKLADYDALVENFRRELNKLNQSTLDHELTDSEFKRVLNTIDSKSIYASAKQLRDHFTLELDDGREIYMRLFSSEPEKNHFQVSNQITVVGKYVNRYDVTILANGLPIVQIELKRSGVDIKEAINQIDRYRVHSYKGLFHYVQMYVVSNSVETRYFSNTDDKRIMKSLTFYWTDEANKRINKLEEFSESFFDKARLRSDSPELKKKIDLIQAFLNEVVVGMDPDADMDESWAQYEQRKRNEEIDTFAKENEIDSEYLKGVIAEYEFSGNMDRDGIREQIKLPLLKARKLINKIEEFILENCLRFQ